MNGVLLRNKNIKQTGDTVTSQLRTGAGIWYVVATAVEHKITQVCYRTPFHSLQKESGFPKTSAVLLICNRSLPTRANDVSDKHPCTTATQPEDEQMDAAKVSHKADGNLYIPAMSSVATEDPVGMPWQQTVPLSLPGIIQVGKQSLYWLMALRAYRLCYQESTIQ
jgi:hypothetical protein